MVNSPFHSSLTNPANLAANRRGQITAQQRTVAQFWPQLLTSGAVALGLGCLLAGFSAALVSSDLSDSELWLPFAFVGGLGLILLFSGAQPLGAYLLTWRDLSADQVAAADGQVAWARNAYRVRGFPRPFWTSDVVALPPGPYRFYYLPTSGRVIGAEALGLPGLSGTHEVQNILGEVLKFSLADLQANQQNQLSAPQSDRLRNGMLGYGLGAAACLCGAFGALGTWLFALTSLFDSDNTPWPIFGLLALIFGSVLAWLAFTRWQDFSAGQVNRVEGFVDKYIVSSRNSRSYYYRVNQGPLRFGVSHPAYEALLPGHYRLYYTQHSKTLLSLEPLPPTA